MVERARRVLGLIKRIFEEGLHISARPDRYVSFFGHQMRFHVSQGLSLVTTQKVNLRSVFGELLCILHGDTAGCHRELGIAS